MAQAQLWGFGASSHNQLAYVQQPDGDSAPYRSPAIIDFCTQHEVLSVGCGHYHTLLVADGGLVFTVGRNEEQQLGRSDSSKQVKRVDALETCAIRLAAGGQDFSVVVDQKSHVYTWGNGTRGQLGTGLRGVEAGMTGVPRLVQALSKVRVAAVACGAQHTLCLDEDGAVYAWGDGTHGQLGNGGYVMQHTPQRVEDLSGRPALAIAAGSGHSMVLTATGRVHAFGLNDKGQLGLGDTQNRLRPTLIKPLKGVIDVAAGGQHSAAVTRDGKLFMFGNNHFGQLGLGEQASAVPSPRAVTDLMEIGLCRAVACGRLHTAVLVECMGGVTGASSVFKVFCFGSNSNKQLGLLPDHPSYGRPSRQTPVSAGGLPTEDLADACLVSGGDCTFLFSLKAPALVTELDASASRSQLHLPGTDRGVFRPGHAQLVSLQASALSEFAKADGPTASSSFDQLCAALQAGFSSPACVFHSFWETSKLGADAHPWRRLSIESAHQAYQAVLSTHSATVLQTLGRASERLALRLQKLDMTEPDDLCPLIVLLFNPLLKKPEQFLTTVDALVTRVTSLPTRVADELTTFYSSLLPVQFQQVLAVFQSYLTYLLTSPGAPEAPVAATVLALKQLHAANEVGHLVDTSSFHNPAIGTNRDLLVDFERWYQDNVFSFCQHPYLLDVNAKRLLLQSEASQQLMLNVSQGLQSGDPSRVLLQLQVRRDHLIADSKSQLMGLHPQQLRLPLKVAFVGEDGVDDGGLRREYFRLVVRELCTTQFSSLNDHTDRVWFDPPSAENIEHYFLTGTLLALAIFNNILVEPFFPRVLFRMLLHQGGDPGTMRFEMHDLDDCDTTLAHGLRQMLRFSGSEEAFEEGFDLRFEVTRPDGSMVELRRGGADQSVTLATRGEFVHLYLQDLFYNRCAASVDAFLQGFLYVWHGSRCLQLLQHHDLELLCNGTPSWDLREWQQSAQYLGYTPTSQCVKWFWDIVHRDFDRKLQQQLLIFVTGTDRVGVQGLGARPLVLQRAGDAERLPAAHTCYNILDLPEYGSREELKKKLTLAITEAHEGFALQ